VLRTFAWTAGWLRALGLGIHFSPIRILFDNIGDTDIDDTDDIGGTDIDGTDGVGGIDDIGGTDIEVPATLGTLMTLGMPTMLEMPMSLRHR
jgi:hypothetical protein